MMMLNFRRRLFQHIYANSARIKPSNLVVLNVARRRRQQWFTTTSITKIVALPTLGDSITEGQIVEYTKNVGDRVEIDDVVAIVETDKVSVDVRSDVAGVVVSLDAEVGESIPIGATLLTFADSDESTTAEHKDTATTATITPVVVPSMGDSITEGQVSVVVQNVGAIVNADDVVIVLETDKVSIDVRTPVAGVVTACLVNEGDTVAVGQTLMEMAPNSDNIDAPNAATTTATEQHQQQTQQRTPRIRFRHGSANATAAATTAATTTTTAQATAATSTVVGTATVRLPVAPMDGENFAVPSQFRRAPLSDAQIDAIDSGAYFADL